MRKFTTPIISSSAWEVVVLDGEDSDSMMNLPIEETLHQTRESALAVVEHWKSKLTALGNDESAVVTECDEDVFRVTSHDGEFTVLIGLNQIG